MGLLDIVIFLPVIGALVLMAIPRPPEKLVKSLAATVTLAALALAVALFASFDRSGLAAGQFQFETRLAWIPSLQAYYHVGVDGINLPLVLLMALLGFLVVLVSWKVHRRVREYFVWLLLLETAVLGVFSSLDLLLFFIFWEIILIPMYFLISIWGTGHCKYSATKYVIYTLTGSAFMLAGLVALYFNTGTLDIVEIQRRLPTVVPVVSSTLIFFLLMVGLAVKLPVFPLHTWLPDAHTDAPTGVSVVLAGALLKMGGYGMIRLGVCLFPEEAHRFAPLFILLAVIGVIYGAALTLRQTDLKKLIAYSSVSHMGYVLLGIFALSDVSLTGAVTQMVSHGLVTGLLFATAGLIMHNAGERDLRQLGGLAGRVPVITVVFVIAGLASLGLPLTSGFAAEFLVFVGSFSSTAVPGIKIYTLVAAGGVVLSAVYILWLVQRVFYGPVLPRFERTRDADGREKFYLLVLVALILVIGLYPAGLTDVIKSTICPVMVWLHP